VPHSFQEVQINESIILPKRVVNFVDTTKEIDSENMTTKTHYLLDVTVLSDNEFQGVKVTEKEFLLALQFEVKKNPKLKFLGSVHGFNVTARDHCTSCKIIQNFKDEESRPFIVIPAIWSNGSEGDHSTNETLDLVADTHHFEPSRMVLFNLARIGREVDLSIMSHGVGSRVLMSYADHTDDRQVTPLFANIFLVAADIWEEAFNARVIAGEEHHEYMVYGGGVGLKLCKMLKKGGKIHVFHNKWDGTLMISKNIYNGTRRRLGQYGSGSQDSYQRLHKSTKLKLKDHDCNSFGLVHDYHTHDSIIKIYLDEMFSKQGKFV